MTSPAGSGRGRPGPGRPDRGSAGLMLVWASAAVLMVSAAMVAWGAAVTARHRAGQVADLAALAAAGAQAWGAAPCSAAARVTARSAAVLQVCRVLADGSVLVVVQAPVTAGGRVAGLRVPPARARARAGAGEPAP